MLRVVAEDLRSWGNNLKYHLHHAYWHDGKDPDYANWIRSSVDSPLTVAHIWLIREWIGVHCATDLLEFHKSAEYSTSFSARLSRLHHARMEFNRLLNEKIVDTFGESIDDLDLLEGIRKDLKYTALGHASHFELIATQFDAQNPRTLPLPNTSRAAPAPPVEVSSSRTFNGGEMVFYNDRVELCGVDICRGRRTIKYRSTLELLTKQGGDGGFRAYSGSELAELIPISADEADLKKREVNAVGHMRHLRRRISKALTRVANIQCSDEDVILSGPNSPGYRFAPRITVRFADPPAIKDITDITDTGEVTDVPNDDVRDVFDVRDDAAGARHAWILQELTKGRRLKARDVSEHFGCSVKTAQRDLSALKDEGRVEFVGAPRTGFYRLRRQTSTGDQSC